MAKCMKCGGMKYKTGGSTMKTTVGSASPKGLIFGIPNAGATGPNMQGMESMKKGGSKVTAVKHSCPPGTVRSATGGCVSQRPTEFKKGGSTFGMLSVKAGVDKNPRATAADRIAGAKMSKKKMGGATNDDKGILTPDNRLKSRRVRSADVSSYGSDASVTRTKLNGDKVTKSYKTENGFVPNSKKTKTVTDKEGNVKSTVTSPIDVNKAARKTNRIVNNVGRNKNDSWSVMKKGGAVKKAAVKKKK